jgi:dihydroflavonol-4-reductase
VQAEVFVTGGSGLVGGRLLKALANSAVATRALARSDDGSSVVAGLGAEPIRGDLLDVGALKEGMAGVEVVYHAAGVNEACSKDSRIMDRVNIDGTVSVIRAAAVAGVRRVVYTSSAVAIGEREGTIGVEDTVHSGVYVSGYARSKHLAEIAAFDEADRLGVDLVVVNPSSVQGPGRATGSAELLLRALNAKRPLLVDTTLSIVDVEDCTTGHINAAKYGKASERYILSGATFSVAEAVGLLSDAVGRQIIPRWLSKDLVRVLGIPAAGIAAIIRPSLGVCPELVRTLLHGHRFDGSKASIDLRFTYTDASGTITRTVAWFEEQGLIRVR